MREERRRRRGKAGKLGIWLTARLTAMLLQTILPELPGWRGEEEGGFGEAVGVRGAGVPAPDWPTGRTGGGAGCTRMVQRRRHGALVHLPVRRKA